MGGPAFWRRYKFLAGGRNTRARSESRAIICGGPTNIGGRGGGAGAHKPELRSAPKVLAVHRRHPPLPSDRKKSPADLGEGMNLVRCRDKLSFFSHPDACHYCVFFLSLGPLAIFVLLSAYWFCLPLYCGKTALSLSRFILWLWLRFRIALFTENLQCWRISSLPAIHHAGWNFEDPGGENVGHSLVAHEILASHCGRQ